MRVVHGACHHAHGVLLARTVSLQPNIDLSAWFRRALNPCDWAMGHAYYLRTGLLGSHGGGHHEQQIEVRCTPRCDFSRRPPLDDVLLGTCPNLLRSVCAVPGVLVSA